MIYKVVSIIDGKFWSFTHGKCRGCTLPIQYTIGTRSTASIGLLYAFSTLGLAREYIIRERSDYEPVAILEARTHCKIHLAIPSTFCHSPVVTIRSVWRMWRSKRRMLEEHMCGLPRGTIGVKSLTPTAVVEKIGW